MSRNTTTQAVLMAALMVLSVIAVPFAFAGGAAALPDGESSVTEGQLVYQGQEVYVDVANDTNPNSSPDLSDASNFRLIQDPTDDNIVVSGLSVRNGSAGEAGAYLEVDSDNLANDNYRIRFTNGSSSETLVNFDILEQTLNLEIDEETSEVSVGNDGDSATVDFTGDSTRSEEFELNVTADGLNENDLNDTFDDTGFDIDEDEDEERITITNFSADGDDRTINFTDIDAGEYDFEFEVVDTEVTQTITVTVEESGEGTLDVDAVDVAQGDIAQFDVELSNTDEGKLVIGNEEEDGYQANVSITDADEDTVTVYFNTYTAGNSGAFNDSEENIVFADSDDATVELESQSNLSAILDSGDYEVSVSNADTYADVLDDPDTISTLTLNERSELGAVQWRAGEDTIEDVEEALEDEDEAAAVEAIGGAVENDLVTETGQFAVQADGNAASDYQIHQISADGLQGLFANETTESADLSEFDTTQAFADGLQKTNSLNGDPGVFLELEEADPGANQDGVTLNLSDLTPTQIDSFTTVVYDESASDYYVIIDTDALVSTASSIGTVEEDQEYDVTFAVQDQRLLDETSDSDDLEDLYEEATWSFDLVEADGEFLGQNDDDEVELEAGEDQEITVDTNVAPGTQLDLRVRSADDTSPSFIKTQSDLVVAPDGTVSGTFDLSEQSVDDEFTSSVRLASFNQEIDGVVVEQVVDEPEDEAPEDETEDDMSEDGNTTDDVSDDSASDDSASDDSASDDSATDGGSSDDGESSEETPGFGAIVALVAVLGAALLASRRQN